MNKNNTETSCIVPSLKFIDAAEKYVNQEPLKALGAACGMGIILNILPTRLMAGSASSLAVMLVRPALLTLGLLKALELIRTKTTI